MIVSKYPRLSIVRQSFLVDVSRSSSHYEGTGERPLNLVLTRRIDEQFLETPRRGSREGGTTLAASGILCWAQAGRVMRARVGLTIERADQVWCTDMTTIPVRRRRSPKEASMPKFIDTQLVILSNAAQREGGTALPPPKSLTIKGAAVNKTTAEKLARLQVLDTRTPRAAWA